VTPLEPGAKRKPALDEASFEQVLAAAYVLQQHNDSLRAQDPRLDSGWVLTQVAETQSLLRAGGLDLRAAAKLIADRLRTMTDSAGVSISLTSDGFLKCVAESGGVAKVSGNSIASQSLVATERLRNGRVFQSADAQKDIRLDLTVCREANVRALLAVPVQQTGEIAGLLEVRWSKADAFHETDVRTSQLMAALITEVLERENRTGLIPDATRQAPDPSLSGWAADEEPVREVSRVDDAVEPSAAQPVAGVAPPDSSSDSSPDSLSDASPNSERPAEALAAQCRVCGRPFQANEAFCGSCSMPRVAGMPSEDLQSKWASLWYMQQAQDGLEEQVESVAESQAGADHLAELQARENVAWQEVEQEQQKRQESVWRRPERVVESGPAPAPTLSVDYDAIAPRSWDDTIREGWGRTLQAVRRQMRRKNAAVTVGSLAIFLLLLIFAWWPSPTPSHLTWFESVLVELGLAQVPSRIPPAPTGNPDARVWVDVHTALYYCPGSDLYGKTPGGQFATQHDAQQDQFEPATGAVCE
jgi:hypothetical protein